jgi:hypothetical protein
VSFGLDGSKFVSAAKRTDLDCFDEMLCIVDGADFSSKAIMLY